MLPHEFQALLDKFARGQCTPEEEQLLNTWYNSIGEGLKNDGLADGEMRLTGERIWNAISPEPKKTSLYRLLARAAIITLPLIAGAILYFNRNITEPAAAYQAPAHVMQETDLHYQNHGESVQKIALSDGSIVTLQPASEIILAKDYGQATRELRLKGEAFFQVQRDAGKPFVVYANEVVTRVLGTSFNVKAYENDGEVTVAVKTGRVAVSASKRSTSGDDKAGQHAEVILTPNQQMVYDRLKEELSKRLVPKPEIILPDSDLFHMQFENEPVSKILRVLEKNYGIEIRYDEEVLSNCTLTTSMSDEGLYERIEVICKAIGASYVIDSDAVITISSNGCQ